ncbi:MAG: hypothetical protein WCP55_16545, partial [Lentisphaerota bacterium]
MLRKIAMLIFTAVGAISLSAQVQSPYPPAPGHENLPVVFWSHYMPQVGTGQIDQNGHAHGGTDSFPFVTCATDSEEQHIIYALDAGINGFQMLTWPAPSMYEAARKVFAKTGKMFYVSPQWSDQGDNFDKAVEQMAKFAVEHKDDPHVFRIDGKQVHFFYGGLKWAGKNNELLPKAKEIIKSKGVEVLFIPEYSPTDKLLLDRTELKYANWPFLKKPEPGPFKWLAETTCDGIDSWGPGDTPYTT